MTEKSDAPGLVAPPPVIYLPAVVLGFLTDRLWPVAFVPDVLQYTLGGALIATSLAIVPGMLREFAKAGDTLRHTQACPGAHHWWSVPVLAQSVIRRADPVLRGCRGHHRYALATPVGRATGADT